MRRLLLAVILAATLPPACGDNGDDAPVTAPSTTSSTETTSPSTTLAPTTTASAQRTTMAPTTTTRPRSTTTTARGPVEEVVDSGTSPAGSWQLVAYREPNGVLCARLRVQARDAGQVCNRPSEQDFNGDETLRYAAGAGNGSFVIGVGVPAVTKVRAELRGGAAVERATVAASFTTAARFVALPLPADPVIRTLAALDAGGGVLTRFTINP